mmetsp:Transcript_28095/g.110459  ORF Transcript_28095/g.110459 Transcript_28095/m.110459 type:complete len:155 (+) Transcript_28095:130-594(+)
MRLSNTPVFLAILLISFGCCSDAGKSVSIGLHAKWRCTPLVLEAAEAISQMYGEFWFWSFVSQATDAPSHANDLEEYKWTMAIVKDMLGDGAKTFVQHQLASRKLSPTVEVHAIQADQVSFTIVKVASYDHVLPGPEKTTVRNVVADQTTGESA